MTRFLRTEAAALALRALLDDNARTAADENNLVARDEEAALHPYLRRHAAAIRSEGGPHTRVHVDALVDRAHAAALDAWRRHNPTERDARFLSLDEIAAVAREDRELAELTRAARARALGQDRAPRPGDEVVRAWFTAPAFDRDRFARDGLPGGARVDARPGRPGRGAAPAGALAAFDFHYRLEAADLGAARLFRGQLEGHALWAVYTTTDGDDAYLEVLDERGATIGGARFLAEKTSWDAFPGRARLTPRWTNLAGVRHEEGYSEPDERAAAGQPPRGWPGELRVDQGHISHDGPLMGAVSFGALRPSPAQRELAVAAFEQLWAVHLRHTVAGETRPIELGPRRQGVLTIGPFTRSTDQRTYLVADWRDIDDGSFVLYFERDPYGLALRVSQFDN